MIENINIKHTVESIICKKMHPYLTFSEFSFACEVKTE